MVSTICESCYRSVRSRRFYYAIFRDYVSFDSYSEKSNGFLSSLRFATISANQNSIAKRADIDRQMPRVMYHILNPYCYQRTTYCLLWMACKRTNAQRLCIKAALKTINIVARVINKNMFIIVSPVTHLHHITFGSNPS